MGEPPSEPRLDRAVTKRIPVLFYRLLFESSSDGIFLCRLADDGELGKFVEVNDVVCDRLGYGRHELLEMTPRDLDVHHTTTERLKWERYARYETEYLTRQGVRVPVEIDANLVSEGNEQLVLATMRDIAEQEPVKLAHLCHEIRNPLNAVIGFSELLVSEVVDPKHRAHAEAIHAAGRTLLTLVNDVLDVPRSAPPDRARIFDPRGVSFRKARLLVADDEEDNRKLLQELLEDTNLEVSTAKNGLEAVRMAHALHPDAILMDVRMPVMDGRAAAEELKRDPATARIPVVGLTAATLPEAEAAGFAHLLPKPVSREELVKLVGHLVGFDPPVFDPGSLDLAVRLLTEHPAAAESVRRLLGPALAALGGAVRVAHAAALAETLESLGREARCEVLLGAAVRLRQATSACDVRGIRAELQYLSSLLERLPREELQHDGR